MNTLITDMQAKLEPQKSTAPAVTEIRSKGKAIAVPSVNIDGRTVVVGGRRLKIASLQYEDLISGSSISHPESFSKPTTEERPEGGFIHVCATRPRY